MKYTASANKEAEHFIQMLKDARDQREHDSPQWATYDAAYVLARLMASQMEKA